MYAVRARKLIRRTKENSIAGPTGKRERNGSVKAARCLATPGPKLRVAKIFPVDPEMLCYRIQRRRNFPYAQ
jgi:hypothetical protein